MTRPLTNVAEFNRQVTVAVKNLTETEFKIFHKKVALEALKRVVMKTPVDTGRCRANWQTTLGAPASGWVPWVETNEEGGIGDNSPHAANATNKALSEGSAKIAKIPLYGVVWLSNNLDYAPVLEFGLFRPPNPGPSRDPRPGRKGKILVENGFSRQAPKGMVNLTFLELLAMFGGAVAPSAASTTNATTGATP